MNDEKIVPELELPASEFTLKVELLARKSGCYIESVLRVCDENDIDYESVGMYIQPPLMEKLSNEAAHNNLLKDIKLSTGALFA